MGSSINNAEHASDGKYYVDEDDNDDDDDEDNNKKDNDNSNCLFPHVIIPTGGSYDESNRTLVSMTEYVGGFFSMLQKKIQEIRSIHFYPKKARWN